MKRLFITIIILFFGCELFTDSKELKNTLTITISNESYEIISNDGFFTSYDEQNNYTYQVNFRDENLDKYATLQLPLDVEKGKIYTNNDFDKNKGFSFSFNIDDEKTFETVTTSSFKLTIDEWNKDGTSKMTFFGALKQKFSDTDVFIHVSSGSIKSKNSNKVEGY